MTAGRLNPTKRGGGGQEEEKRSARHQRHSHLHHPRTMIADGSISWGEGKTPTTPLVLHSSSRQEIDQQQSSVVTKEGGEGEEEKERRTRRSRRERRAPQRYWYRGGWQRKPRRPPEFSRQNQRLSTTPSTLQPRQRAELAELIRCDHDKGGVNI